MESVEIRSPQQGDINFILSTFLKGIKYGSPVFKEVESKAYFKEYHQKLLGILSRTHLTARMAVLGSDPSIILGYAIVEPQGDSDVLHYVYVKAGWRRQGIAKKLLSNLKITHVSHITDMTEETRKGMGLLYNPWLA